MKALLCLRSFPEGAKTLLFGGMVAALEEADLVILTVVGANEDARPVEEKLNLALDQLRAQGIPNGKVTKIRRGPTIAQIKEELDEEDYDMVILGTQDARRMWTAIFGSITSRVTEQVAVTVLVVRNPSPAIKRILVCIGGARTRRKIMRTAGRLAEEAGASVTVLHVTDPVPAMYTGLNAMDESLTELLQTDTPTARYLRWSADYLDRHGVDAQVVMRQGVAPEEILREARRGDYDLIVMGASTKGTLQRALSERVNQRILDEAPCPVLIVH